MHSHGDSCVKQLVACLLAVQNHGTEPASSPDGVLLVPRSGADLGALQHRVAQPHVHANLDGGHVGLQRCDQRRRQALDSTRCTATSIE